MGVHQNLDRGTRNLDGGTLTLDGGTRPPASPYNSSTDYNEMLTTNEPQRQSILQVV